MAAATNDTPVFITGATGFMGSYLLRYLWQCGYTRIRALRRSQSAMDLVADVADQVEWVEGDVLDPVILEEAMQGIRQVYHCAALVSFDSRDRRQMMAINAHGTANMVNAALYAGIDKLVQVSSIATLGRTRDGSLLDEQAKWQRSDFNTNYSISKFLAEQEVWRGIAEGLCAAIINPCVILGGGRWQEGTPQIFKTIAGGYPFYTSGTVSLVDVRDVARFAVQLMESEVHSERFILAAESWGYEAFLKAVAAELGVRPPWLKARGWMLGLAWRSAWLWARLSGTRPLLTRETAMNARLNFRYDNSKSIQQFDFHYTPLAQTIAETARQFLEAQREPGLPARVLPFV
jgi:nucleoside-diphosphate-sugar epimerase